MRARWIVATLSALALALLTLPVPLPLFDHVDAGIEAAAGNGQACPANAKPAATMVLRARKPASERS